MARRKIALQYSGFVVFASRLVSVITGLAFNLMVARSAIITPTIDEYGVWGNLYQILLPYFTLVSGVIPFWTMRFVARGKEGAVKTGVFANTLLAVAAAVIYLSLIPLLTSFFKAEAYTLVYAIAALQIIEMYLISVLEFCLQAQQPQYVGYGFIVGDTCRVFLGLIFMIVLQQRLLGAILSIVIALALKVIFYFKVLIIEFKQKINFNYIREWLKGSAFNLYNILGDRIATSVFLMMSHYGGQQAQGYYTASTLVATVVTYSSFLAFALYPKLLAENNLEDATTSLKMVLMFAVPMAAGVIGLADSYLIIQDVSYAVAEPIIITLAVDALVITLSSIYYYVLLGIEKVDEKAEIPFRQVAKSKLFIVFSLPYAHSAITLPTTFYVINNFAQNNPLLITTSVVLINTMAHLAMFIVLYAIVRGAAKVIVPYKNIAKYIFASAVMAIILRLIPHPTTIMLTLIVTAVGGIIYMSILLAIDAETRTLAFTIFREFKKRMLREA
ncbi:MAG: hypothetical protein QXJ53_00280 [Candidatus Bathyarchaeia archaeon]